MSKVKIEGNASGTGTLTISAPNTDTDRALTIPDSAGELLTDGSGLSATNLTSGTIPDARFPSTLPAVDGSALTGISAGETVGAWISMDGRNTASILDSYNVSSISDQGTGLYDVNVASNFANANYAIPCGGTTSTTENNIRINSYATSSGQFRLIAKVATTGGTIDSICYASAYGDQ